ncbi:MAG: ArsR/SmtB family transcription factor [Thermoanaerobaculaceae bacterium]
MSASPLSRQVQIHKAIGHPARLRILAMLRHGEFCVCQVTAVLQLAASTVSAHLAELKVVGLVEERKAGRWVHYRLSGPGQATLDGVWAAIAHDPAVADDRRLLAAMATIPVEAVCRPDFDLRRAVDSKECCR